MTEEEITTIETVDELKVRQVLARVTNEILASIIVPARRAKAEREEAFLGKVEALEEEEKKNAEKEFYTNKNVEIQVWLKDFPITAADFKELKRSGA